MARFTKQAIMSTFLSLVAEHPLDKITVTDIVRACGINRNTFYYYFHDIYALAAAVFEQETAKVFASAAPDAGFDEIFCAALAAAKKNRRMVYHIYRADHVLLESHLYRSVHALLRPRLCAAADAAGCTAEQAELLARFYAHAVVGSFVCWLNRGMRDDAEGSVRALAELFSDGSWLRPLGLAEAAAKKAAV